MNERRGREARRSTRQARRAVHGARAATRTLPAGVAIALVLAAAALLHFDNWRAPFFADDFLFLDQVRDRSLPAPAHLTRSDRQLLPSGESTAVVLVAGGTDPRVADRLPRGQPGALPRHHLAAIRARQTLARDAPGLIGATLLAVTHAADDAAPLGVRSQDLLAVTGALAAILLFVNGRRWALRSRCSPRCSPKESVAVTPLIAALVARHSGESWRRTATRAWPLAAVLAVWAALWLLTLGRRPALAHELHVGGLDGGGGVRPSAAARHRPGVAAAAAAEAW